MPTLTETTSASELATCSAVAPCAACIKRAGGSIPRGTLRSHEAKPIGGWRKHYLPGEDPDTTPVFGVELETAVAYVPYGAANTTLNVSEAVAVAGPRGWWLPKHDSSVSGPEFASQPGSLAYWRHIRPAVGRMLQTLVHGGVRSWDGIDGAEPTCGAHISMSLRTFDDADHLTRFADLVYANPRFSTRMSGRIHAQMTWCAIAGSRATVAQDQAEWAREAYRDGYTSQDRYQALNAPGDDRIEFRMPRGTLRVDTLYAHIEWAASMQEFTRDSHNAPTPAAYSAWLAGHAEDFPEAARRARTLFPGRFGEVGPRTPRRARTARTTSPDPQPRNPSLTARCAYTTLRGNRCWTTAEPETSRCALHTRAFLYEDREAAMADVMAAYSSPVRPIEAHIEPVAPCSCGVCMAAWPITPVQSEA